MMFSDDFSELFFFLLTIPVLVPPVYVTSTYLYKIKIYISFLLALIYMSRK